MTDSTRVAAYLGEWRAAEEKFFRSVMADPDLYMASIRFVRAAADDLNEIETLGDLVRCFERGKASDLGPVAERLQVPKLVLLDCGLARGAAFHLRAGQIQESDVAGEAARRLAEARAHNQPWVVLWNHEREQNGHVFFDRLEVQVADAIGLHVTHGIDLEAGWIYSLESVRIDAETGRVMGDESFRGQRQDFATQPELDRELARRKSELTAPGGLG